MPKVPRDLIRFPFRLLAHHLFPDEPARQRCFPAPLPLRKQNLCLTRSKWASSPSSSPSRPLDLHKQSQPRPLEKPKPQFAETRLVQRTVARTASAVQPVWAVNAPLMAKATHAKTAPVEPPARPADARIAKPAKTASAKLDAPTASAVPLAKTANARTAKAARVAAAQVLAAVRRAN